MLGQPRPAPLWPMAAAVMALAFSTPADGSSGGQGRPFAPPEGFVRVPACPCVGVMSDFYVSKFEMKIDGEDDGDRPYDPSFVAASRPDGTPWVNVTLVQARAECAALGEGYHLITNAEWMAIARNIESVGANWSDNHPHPSGRSDAWLNVGHSCREGLRGTAYRRNGGQGFTEGMLPASPHDSEGLFGLIRGDFEASTQTLDANGWNLYRRTHYLSNGEVIWDFAGNVWDWVDWHVPLAADRARIDDHVDENYLEINACAPTNAMPSISFRSANNDIADLTPYIGGNYFPVEDPYGLRVDELTNLNRLGRFHPTSRDANAGAAMRGGSYTHGDADNGVYALGMGYGPSPEEIHCVAGFRCVWTPPESTPLPAAPSAWLFH